MVYCWIGILIFVLLVAHCRKYSSSRPPAGSSPYSRPTAFFPLKAFIFYLMMELRKRKSNETAGYGASSYSDVSLMERPQRLPDKVKAIDAVFFSGADSNGWSIILAMQRRPNRVTTILVYLQIPDEGIYVPVSHPDCLSFREPDDEHNFKSGGLEITMIKPMEKWQLKFEGALKNCHTTCNQKEISIELEFKSKWRHFDFDKDMDKWATSKAFAREPWSSNFFENLKAHHQTHYEQMGKLSGTVQIDGRIKAVTMPAFRDHSYGSRRDWSLMHRYAFHHVFMDDGSKGVVGVVCQPSTCTRLVCGHWWLPNGEGHPISEIDLVLEEHGEGGEPPHDYAFQFTAGGIQRTVEVATNDVTAHYLDWDWEAKFYEVFVEYKIECVVGRGICEWQYRHGKGRPILCTDSDPDWTQPMRQQYLTN